MDQTVKRIRPADFELSTVQDNLANCIDQLLTSAQSTASSNQFVLFPTLKNIAGPGSTKTLDKQALVVNGDTSKSGVPVVQFGTPATATVAQIDAPFNLYGTLTTFGNGIFRTPTGGYLAVTPASAGTCFYTTSVGNTAVRLTIDDTGSLNSSATVAATNVVSSVGFKNTIPCGTFWHNAYVANATYQMQEAVVNTNGNGLGSTPFLMKFTHAGSIIGMSLNQAGPITGSNFLIIYKNGAAVYTWNAGAGNNNSTFWVAFPKNSAGLTFVAGDTLTVYHQNNASGNTQIKAFLTLEMSA